MNGLYPEDGAYGLIREDQLTVEVHLMSDLEKTRALLRAELAEREQKAATEEQAFQTEVTRRIEERIGEDLPLWLRLLRHFSDASEVRVHISVIGSDVGFWGTKKEWELQKAELYLFGSQPRRKLDIALTSLFPDRTRSVRRSTELFEKYAERLGKALGDGFDVRFDEDSRCLSISWSKLTRK